MPKFLTTGLTGLYISIAAFVISVLLSFFITKYAHHFFIEQSFVTAGILALIGGLFIADSIKVLIRIFYKIKTLKGDKDDEKESRGNV